MRSCGGLVPFYLKQSGHRFVIATRLGDFVRYLPDEPRLDPLVNAMTLLIEKLTRDLDPEDGNLLTLSGGVDSSSLAALAAGVVQRKVWTWSLLPRKERQDLVQHEMSFIEPLAQQYGFARRWEIHAHERLMLELWQAAPRIVFHVVYPALCSLPAVMREAPVRVLFGGEFADVVCGSVFTVPDWAEQTPLWRLMLDFKPQSGYLRTALHNDVPSRNLYRQDKGRRDEAGIKSMQSLQEPLPDEPLPQELEGVLSLGWFSHPPKEVDYWPFRCLTRLTLFVDSLRARRLGREERRVSVGNTPTARRG